MSLTYLISRLNDNKEMLIDIVLSILWIASLLVAGYFVACFLADNYLFILSACVFVILAFKFPILKDTSPK